MSICDFDERLDAPLISTGFEELNFAILLQSFKIVVKMFGLWLCLGYVHMYFV